MFILLKRETDSSIGLDETSVLGIYKTAKFAVADMYLEAIEKMSLVSDDKLQMNLLKDSITLFEKGRGNDFSLIFWIDESNITDYEN